MNSHHRAIRAILTTMAPVRAIEYIRYFQLPPEEELALIECDIRGKSNIRVAMENNMSPETIKRRKRKAYAHIADWELNNT